MVAVWIPLALGGGRGSGGWGGGEVGVADSDADGEGGWRCCCSCGGGGRRGDEVGRARRGILRLRELPAPGEPAAASGAVRVGVLRVYGDCELKFETFGQFPPFLCTFCSLFVLGLLDSGCLESRYLEFVGVLKANRCSEVLGCSIELVAL